VKNIRHRNIGGIYTVCFPSGADIWAFQFLRKAVWLILKIIPTIDNSKGFLRRETPILS